MHRVTVTLDDDLMAELDRLVSAGSYQNRSEAVRDLARAGIQQTLIDTHGSPDCIAALVYVYDYEARELAVRLARLFHDNHDLSVATTHLHLNHHSGMEVALLKGPTERVQALAHGILAERGVRYGRSVLIPTVQEDDPHHHDASGPAHRHVRTR